MSTTTKRSGWPWLSAAIAVLCLATTATRADTLSRPVYLSGHCDLRANYTPSDGKMTLNYHFDNTGQAEGDLPLNGKYASTDLYTRVPSSTKTSVPNQTYADFMGADVGDDVWILPQTQDQTHPTPFLGFSTEDLEEDDWSTGITYAFLGLSGPGEFSMWQSGTFGAASVYWSSANVTKTLNGNTILSMFAHQHANWGFTAEGVYDVQIQVSGTLDDGVTTVSSDVKTFTFLVGDTATVPEPGAMIMLAGAAAAGFIAWRRRRQ